MTEEIKKQKNNLNKSGSDIFIVRIIVCVVILISTLVLRFNNQYIYDSVKFWYKENVLEERYSFEAIIKNTKTICLPFKEKILNLFSNLSFLNSANK